MYHRTRLSLLELFFTYFIDNNQFFNLKKVKIIPKALLIGNDINNATSSYSWNDLIDGLLDYSKMTKSIQNKNKPFPFLYEEIYLKSHYLYQTPENRLKKYIASQTRKLESNKLHSLILDLGIENILTTNYDSLFENTAGLTNKDCGNKGIVKENLYSLFRYHELQNHKLWHILEFQ